MVLAVTNQITQEVAAIPFLWVLPLTIYLLSFVLTFSGRSWYHRKLFTILLLLGTAGWFIATLNPSPDYILEIIIYNFLLFAACMVCHGELYALRPAASHLTRFYLMVSVGGALGGILVNFVAPFLFRGYWELFFRNGFYLDTADSFYCTGRKAKNRDPASACCSARLPPCSPSYSGLGDLFFSKWKFIHPRSFYGVVSVRQTEVETILQEANLLVHGTTVHGLQFLDPAAAEISPTSYYSQDSGIGLAILKSSTLWFGAAGRNPGPWDRDAGRIWTTRGPLSLLRDQPERYRPGKWHREAISPSCRTARRPSTSSPGMRVSHLKKKHAGRTGNDFDILVLDTFSSDSIPVHLVTREAFDIYLQNLCPGWFDRCQIYPMSGLICARSSGRWLNTTRWGLP